MSHAMQAGISQSEAQFPAHWINGMYEVGHTL